MHHPADTHVVQTAIAAARQAGAVARTAFNEAIMGRGPAYEEKAGHFDIVTAADREAELQASEIILSRVPDSKILGEEKGWQGSGNITWYIDPIDGTSNFASGLPFFCVSIGAFGEDGRPICGVVYDPMREELFLSDRNGLTINDEPVNLPPHPVTDRTAELFTNVPHEGAHPDASELARFADLVAAFRGVRRMGSCALQMAYVAAGRAAAGYDEKFQAWDVAAGLQLVAAAGGHISAWNADGELLSNPLLKIEDVKRFLIAGKTFDIDNSMMVAHATSKAF